MSKPDNAWRSNGDAKTRYAAEWQREDMPCNGMAKIEEQRKTQQRLRSDSQRFATELHRAAVQWKSKAQLRCGMA